MQPLGRIKIMSIKLTKKASDEGTSSPFQARLFFGILELRDQLFLLGSDYPEKAEKARKFDQSFQPVLEAAQATRDAAREVVTSIDTHTKAIEVGRAVQFRKNQFDILETIDVPLGQSVDKLIDQSVVAIKTGLQKMLKDQLDLDIDFLFQKETPFVTGIANLLSNGEKTLANYLEAVRNTWLSDLLQLRNDHEHHGWNLGGLQYHSVEQSILVVKLPVVLELPVDKFARFTANRVLLFIENMLAHAIQRNRNDWYPVYLAEIPIEQRDPRNVQRFRLSTKSLYELPPWELKYQDSMDFV